MKKNEENKQFIEAVITASVGFGIVLVWTVVSIYWLINRLSDSGQI